MGCSGSNQENKKNIVPLKIDEENIKTMIFNFDNRFKISVITQPFFRLGNLFMQCLLKKGNTELYNNINHYKFYYKAQNISNAFYKNDEVSSLGIKSISIEIIVGENDQ